METVLYKEVWRKEERGVGSRWCFLTVLSKTAAVSSYYIAKIDVDKQGKVAKINI